jgi:signal transduction histidine kinase
MLSETEEPSVSQRHETAPSPPDAAAAASSRGAIRRSGLPRRVLVADDDRDIRESLEDLLEDEGYEVLSAENGKQALKCLQSGGGADAILLDLRMPEMDGWEFRALQKNDERLKGIPVVALSGDRSPQALAISADAYLRKPVATAELLATLDRVIREREMKEMSEQLEAAQRLASLGRVAAGVGHEINNPLAFAMLNLSVSLKRLTDLREGRLSPSGPSVQLIDLGDLGNPLDEITGMLEEAAVGLERIRQTVGNLQQLSRKPERVLAPVGLEEVIDRAVAMAWNQIRHRARLVKDYGATGAVHGDASALGQVFLNLLLNAAQAIHEGGAEHNEIVISTRRSGREVIVEIRDTGEGIASEVLPHVSEPFFTTKPVGLGTGLGLSICSQTVADHGGRLEIESPPAGGTKVRVHLPAPDLEERGGEARASGARQGGPAPRPLRRGRVLVIDDEPLIGRVVRTALSTEHDVEVVVHAAEGLAMLEKGMTFDLILCDLAMPEVSGPAVFEAISQRWPSLLPHLVFMTGGAFTPSLAAFLEKPSIQVLAKPFRVEDLRRVAREHVPET